jgi:hypothetical protein
MSNPNRGMLSANLEGIPGSFGTSTAAPVADRLRTTQRTVRSPNLMTAPSETKYRGALVFRPSITRRLPQMRYLFHPGSHQSCQTTLQVPSARRLRFFFQKLDIFLKQPVALILRQRRRTLYRGFCWKRKISSARALGNEYRANQKHQKNSAAPTETRRLR